jgi:type VI secretion system protein ImpK
MSPEFAAAFDPVMLEVLGLLDRVRGGSAGVPEQERARVRGAIEQATSRISGARSKDWELASYALTALVDELLIVDVPWTGQGWWENHALEVDLFRSRNRATAFFDRAEQAVGLASRDALETFILAVVLGFRGMFRDQPQALEAWLKKQEQLVRVGQGRPPVPDTPVELSGAPPLSGRAKLMWASLATALAAACGVVAAWGLAMLR